MDIASSQTSNLRIFHPHDKIKGHAVILLNYSETSFTISYLNIILEGCSLFACVDGAANILYSDISALTKLPNFISGDFDSISSEAYNYFKSKGVKTYHTPDQSKTDLVKCIEIVLAMGDTVVLNSLVILPSLHGRIDHVFGNLNAAFVTRKIKKQDNKSNTTLFFLAGNPRCEQLLCLLEPVTNIDLTGLGLVGSTCGLIPINGPCQSVKTCGLKWNLDSEPLAFGNVISTSNKICNERISVQSDNDLVWVMQIGELQANGSSS